MCVLPVDERYMNPQMDMEYILYVDEICAKGGWYSIL